MNVLDMSTRHIYKTDIRYILFSSNRFTLCPSLSPSDL
jgi:hypothetical protein